QDAAERVRGLLAQTDADAESVRARSGMVDQLVDDLVERTRDAGQRVGEVEDAWVGELQGATERVRVLLEQAEAVGEAVRSRSGMVEELVDGFIERTRDAGQRVGEVEDSSVGELRESVERVRAEVARIDREADELRSRRVMLDALDDALIEAAS